MVQAMEMVMIKQQDVPKPREVHNLKLDSVWIVFLIINVGSGLMDPHALQY